MKTEKNKLLLKTIFFIGFIMILASAIDYLSGWNKISSAIGAIGITFVACGMIFGHAKNRFSKTHPSLEPSRHLSLTQSVT